MSTQSTSGAGGRDAMPRASRWVFWMGLAALSVGAVWLILYATPFGVGLSWDSFTYVSAARGLRAGLGLARANACGELKFMTGYPPLYPLALAGFEWLGLGAIRAARGISALSFGVTVLLVGLVIRRLTASRSAALLGTLTAATSTTLLAVYTWAWTEPAFIVFSVLSLVFLAKYLESGRTWPLFVSGSCLAVAMLLRYAGIAYLGAAGFGLLLHAWLARKEGTWTSIRHGVLLVIGAATPIAVWILRNSLLGGTLTNRRLEWHPVGADNLDQLGRTLAAWLLPSETNPLAQPITRRALAGELEPLIALLLGAVLMLAMVRAWRLAVREHRVGLETLLLGSLAVYLVFLGISISLFDSRIPLDDRILSPAYTTVLLLAVTALHRLWSTRVLTLRVLAAIAGSAVLLTQGQQLASTVRILRSDGQGYAATRWKSSRVIESLRERAPQIVYTNEIPALYFNAGMVACSIPVRDAEDGLEQMRRDLGRPGAVLVLLGRVTSEYVPLEGLTEGLQVVYDVPWDGIMFEVASPGPH